MLFLVSRASRATFDRDDPPCADAYIECYVKMGATPYREDMPANSGGFPLEWLFNGWMVKFEEMTDLSKFIEREGDIVIRREEWPHPNRLTIYDASIE